MFRTKEKEILDTPYPPLKIANDRRFANAIGARVVSSAKLGKEIHDDLDTSTFGISWWSHLNQQERILVSDYLYQCVYGIEANLIEARLHYYMWQNVRDLQDERIKDAVQLNRHGMPETKLPESTKPYDDLPNKLEGMHITGFFRAIGSSLDCLGAAIIGVLGLQKKLRRCYFKDAQNSFSNLENAQPPAKPIHFEFRDAYNKAVANCGPIGWIYWATLYRNSLVHRGRPVWTHQLFPRSIIDTPWATSFRNSQETHLEKYPDWSDVESWAKTVHPILAEEANRTLSGLYDSAMKFSEAICEELLTVWKKRRIDPNLVKQPKNQWTLSGKRSEFNGYSSLHEVEFDEVTTSPLLVKRMKAASVYPKSARNLWQHSPWLKDE